jgi:predicted RNase H-like HicB family nuclease
MEKKDRYIFAAVFSHEPDGIAVEFPDLPGCLTCGKDELEALRMAEEALAGHILTIEEQGWAVPEPTPVRKIRAEEGQSVVLVAADMPLVREAARNRAVKKTLTIPQWLDELAREKDVNFSLVLQEALKERLRVSSGRKRTK